MKSLVVLFVIALSAVSKSHHVLSLLNYYSLQQCDEYKDVSLDYRTSSYNFTILMYQVMGLRSDLHFFFSPLSIWRSLAAIAEGADPVIQPQLFKFLSLSNDPCIRQKYYSIMNSLVVPGDDVKITNKRTLVLDEDLTINQNWLSTIYKNSMLDITSLPIKNNPVAAANYMRQLISSPLNRLNLNGNSVILDSVEYKGLWTSAFADAIVQLAPFYEQSGQKIGSVDLMTMSKRVKMAYVPELTMKLMELPIGVNSRYRLIVGIIMSNDNNLQEVIYKMTTPIFFKMIDNLRESHIPIDIAIPRFTMTSDIDVRSILEDMGLSHAWVHPAATSYISEPAALPSSYAQRATLTFDEQGISPNLQEPTYNVSTGLDPILGRDFIANKPFFIAITDAELHTCILSCAFTKPTYNY